MSVYRPLKYREITAILKNLGFRPEKTGSTSHQTWILEKGGRKHAVTIMFHGANIEFKRGTLGSIIRQSGFSKEEFYDALKKKRKN